MQKGVVKKPRYKIVVPGIRFHFVKKGSTPYEVRVMWPSVHNERFATLEEALARRAEDVEVQIAESIKRTNDKKPRTEAERTFVTQKRAADLARCANNCKQEREVTNDLARMWTEFTGFEAIVLNDFTRADLLLSFDAEATLWLPVQVKTANNSTNRKSKWGFNKVKGYTGMPVVCWAVDIGIGWLHDGKDLEAMGVGELAITHNGMDAPRTSHEKEWNGRCVFDMKGILETIRSEKDRWPLVTEEFARWDFKCRKSFVEMLTLETYRRKYPGKYDFPDEQNGRADLVGKPPAEGGNGLRVQLKSAHGNVNAMGFFVQMHVNAGHDDDGKQLYEPYESYDFDELVVVSIAPHTWDAYVWEIPMSKLIEKGIVGHELIKGKTECYVHATEDITGKTRPVSQSVWTRDFYKGVWDLPERTDVIRDACTKHGY